MTQFPTLFSPFKVRDVELPNRVVMAPMSTELGGKNGEVTDAMIAFYTERAKGGFGLIIVEYTCVDVSTGRAHEYQLTLEGRDNLDGHIRLVKSVHDAGAKIFMQMQHSGQYAVAKLLPDGMPVGPCDVFHPRQSARRRMGWPRRKPVALPARRDPRHPRLDWQCALYLPHLSR